MNTDELLAALPELETTLGGLRDFQRTTVDYVFRRMYLDEDYTTRFLVADEVGLGKTKVAQGVVARALAHLHDKIERIDIVYVCSNASIARQNLQRINPLRGQEFGFASRLTMLPLELHALRKSRVNLISFTPGTAIDTSGTGRWEERALLYWMLLDQIPGVVGATGTALRNLLQAGVSTPERWKERLESSRMWPDTDPAPRQGQRYDARIAEVFCAAIVADKPFGERLRLALDRFARHRKDLSPDDSHLRSEVTGGLRQRLAKVCVDALEPDVVILDEFQRFQDLLTGDDDAAELARALLDYTDPNGNEVRVLLLSATPYRMFTMADEDEDHHSGFLETFRFLARDKPGEVEAINQDLAAHRRAMTGHDGDPKVTAAAVRARLIRTMCRTERIALTRERDAMLKDVPVSSPVTTADVRRGVWLDRAAHEVGAANPVEYWKSVPYALSFLRDYELKRKLRESAERPTKGLLTALQNLDSDIVRRDGIKKWEPLACDGRLKSLSDATLDAGLWKLLWMPPSLPYIEPTDAYADVGTCTKALVFSAWNAVPDAIGAVLSYEAERRTVASDDTQAASYDTVGERARPLLFRMSREGGVERPAGMMALALLYPSVTLATTLDPLLIALEETSGNPVSLQRMRERIRERFQRLVDDKVRRFGDDVGQVDQRWYWALPVLLDAGKPRLIEWLDVRKGAVDERFESVPHDEDELEARRFIGLFDEEDEDGERRVDGFTHHVTALRDIALRARAGEAKILGRPPEDLIEVLADLALASPAVCALRALRRVVRDEIDPDHWILLAAAARIGRGFRTLFNVPETIALLRGGETDGEDGTAPYWRRVLAYCTGGNLQSVLDEYVHVKLDDTGTRDKPAATQAREIADAISEALSPRTSTVTVDDVRARPRAERIDIDELRVRCRFAMRFGDGHDDRDASTVRAGVVKAAFNSPFRPFVLATTSIGQEGLDFHHYCHAVYHWNLPSNPVDLEQREGRVHRFKGHAVRRNVALRYGLTGLSSFWKEQAEDPWDCLFRLARDDARAAGSSELVPFWVFETEGGVSVERRVPMLPMSRELADLGRLKRGLATYRLVFGQARQEDLLALLHKRGIGEDAGAQEAWRVDLGPPRE
jgi:hypothetical protein